VDHSPKQYVNLGCGTRYDPNWINFDIVPAGPQVRPHDLTRGIPLPSGSCQVVYHSHVLEHIRRAEVKSFLRECLRVLKPGGILRVAVPDLERICRLYLEKLEGALKGDQRAARDYEWIMLEMYDQVVREQWRSEMWLYLNRDSLSNEQFVRDRIGNFRDNDPPAHAALVRPSLLRRLLRTSARQIIDSLHWFKPARALRIGYFRMSGEVHQWMYDRHSLAKLLLDIGFANPLQQTAASSQIPNWKSFHLDTAPDGSSYKPDSLYMEAMKP